MKGFVLGIILTLIALVVWRVYSPQSGIREFQVRTATSAILKTHLAMSAVDASTDRTRRNRKTRFPRTRKIWSLARNFT